MLVQDVSHPWISPPESPNCFLRTRTIKIGMNSSYYLDSFSKNMADWPNKPVLLLLFAELNAYDLLLQVQ